ncbi:MAG: ABC transporter ATP-binding protein [bacterium]|nr:ABC transporter ATP-binding protein [bacterium]
MIEIKNVSKNYDGIHNVVDNLSLTIPTGTVFGFLGPNGAGKTTTIKMLVGINKPDSGEININKKQPTLTTTREAISFMPEEPHFYDQLTGLEFLEFSVSLFGKNKQSKINLGEILKKTGIYEARDAKIKTYSKGMKQRLGFAQALVNNPDYIFLDEPLDGLDPIGRRDLKLAIENLKMEGKTIFFNSHILADVEILCDQIGIIHRGQLIYSGSVNEFKKSKSLEDQFVETIKKLENNSE